MVGGRERIVEPDLDVSAAERSAAGRVIGAPGLVPGGALDQQPGLEPSTIRLAQAGRRPDTCRWRRRTAAGRAAAQRLWRPRRRSRSALHATHIRNRYRTIKEAELQPDGDGLEHRVALLQLERHLEVPSSISSPGLSTSGPSIRRPLSTRPVGRTQVGEHPRAAPGADLGVLARDVGVVDDHVALPAAARSSTPAGPTTSRLPSTRAAAVWARARARSSQRLGDPLGGAVDHRAARLFVGRCLRRIGLASGGCTTRVWIPNSPSPRRSSVSNSTTGREHQRQPLPPRVLEQVAGELLGQRGFVVGEALAVARATGTRGTRWAHTCGRPRTTCAPPSPEPACARSRPAAPRSGTHG